MFRRKEENGEFENDSNINEASENDANEQNISAIKSNTTSIAQATSSQNQTASNAVKAPVAPTKAPIASSVPAYRAPGSGAAFSPAAAQQALETRMPIGSNQSQQQAASNQQNAAANIAGKTTSKRILTVGNDILLKGEISTCDRLVIEGAVDATLKDVHTVEITETGSFKGTAEIEDAEISGLFEGDLIVRNRLTIYSTGKVRGRISYGEIEIERGGELTGEISINNAYAQAANKSKQAA